MILFVHFKTLNILHIFQGDIHKMEFLLFIVAIIAVLGWFVWKDRKFEESGSHPLDSVTKASETTTKPDGIGHESVPVVPTLTNVLDINQDGKVDIKDAVAAAEVVVKKTKKVANTTKAKAKKVVEQTKKAVKKPKTKKSS